MAQLRNAVKFDPLLSLDCAGGKLQEQERPAFLSALVVFEVGEGVKSVGNQEETPVAVDGATKRRRQ